VASPASELWGTSPHAREDHGRSVAQLSRGDVAQFWRAAKAYGVCGVDSDEGTDRLFARGVQPVDREALSDRLFARGVQPVDREALSDRLFARGVRGVGSDSWGKEESGSRRAAGLVSAAAPPGGYGARRRGSAKHLRIALGSAAVAMVIVSATRHDSHG